MRAHRSTTQAFPAMKSVKKVIAADVLAAYAVASLGNRGLGKHLDDIDSLYFDSRGFEPGRHMDPTS